MVNLFITFYYLQFEVYQSIRHGFIGRLMVLLTRIDLLNFFLKFPWLSRL